jgi:hypothetical protein
MDNPVVAQAQKKIPWYKRAGKLIKEHEKTIYLTLEGIGALAMSYWFYRRRLMKLQRDFDAKAVESLKLGAGQLKGAVDVADHATTTVIETAKGQIEQRTTQKILEGRLRVLEETLKDPKFHEYLKRKHGITGLRAVKK